MGSLKISPRCCLTSCANLSNSGRSRQTRYAAGRWPMYSSRVRLVPGAMAQIELSCAVSSVRWPRIAPTMARRSLVLRAMGAQPLLHPVAVPWRHRVPTGAKVRVYIDVSGSMSSVLKALYGAVLDCQNLVFRTVYLFSTKVADMSLADLKAGRCESTGGTDIGCVAEHMARNRVTRALVITDGWVGTPRGQHLLTLTQSRLAVAYLGDNFNDVDLHSVARHTAVLKTGA
jgi:hypothetical protein